jgi:histidinol-phosphate aminotransferase
MTPQDPSLLIRPLVQKLHPYTPGEQPKIPGLVKLNTNENPYPPSPRVLSATRAAVDGRLRLYPNPTADGLREKLAKLHRCAAENLIVGNGSDELLALAVRAFAEPGLAFAGRKPSRALVQYFWPSYSLYPVLAAIHGSRPHPVALRPDFGLPGWRELRRERAWDSNAALTFITTPNAPSGQGYSTDELDVLCRAQKGVVVLDEAYVDFAGENALKLALQHPHVLVARTFSKAYSLCFQRVGYMVGHPELIGALHKIRDSYNVNGLGQAAATATLDDLGYYRKNFQTIIKTRERTAAELEALGFRVHPSQTNFLLVRPPGAPAEEWLAQLRARKILVRWFDQQQIRAYLRITIGTPQEMRALLQAVKAILERAGARK